MKIVGPVQRLFLMLIPCLEARFLITTLVEQVVFVHVVDVDELSGLDHVADYPSVQRQPHLSLLKTKLYIDATQSLPTSVLPSANVFPSKTLATSSLLFLSTRNKEHRSACKHIILRFSNKQEECYEEDWTLTLFTDI